jgi:hypothetical protein
VAIPPSPPNQLNRGDGTCPTPTVFNILHHQLLRRLVAFELHMDHFVIFGSGPLLAHGLRTDIGDLDIVARGPAWDRARRLGVPAKSPLHGTEMAYLCGGCIEVSTDWISSEWDTNQLIDDCDVFDGFRFAKVDYVLAYKRALLRPKDAKDILLIENYLNELASRYRSGS